MIELKPLHIGVLFSSSISDNQLVRADGTSKQYIQACPNIYVDDNGFLGINEASPITLLELTHASPIISLHCSTETDAAGARACRINARGEQSGGEETMLGFMEFAHDEANDDQKAFWRVGVNASADGESPTERMRILSNGYVGINKIDPSFRLVISHSSYNVCRMINTEASSASAGCGILAQSIDGAVMSSGDRLGFFLFGGSISANGYANSGGIVAYADDTWTTSSAPTKIFFEVAPSGSLTRVAVLAIKSSGNVGIGTTAPDKALEINKSTGGEIRLTYNDAAGSATDYCDFVTDANGGLTVTTVDSDGAAGDIVLSPDGLVKVTTDMIFSGSGSGFPYGCIAGDNETVTCTDQSTYYQVTFDTVGCENLVTGSTDENHITIQKTGNYRMTAFASFHSAVAHDFEFQVKKNGGTADVPHAHSFQTTAVANQVEGTTISAICTLTANDTLELWVQCTDAAGQNCIFDHVNLCVNMLGGA